MTDDYPKKIYQRKMRAYLDALRSELDQIESHLEATGDDPTTEKPDKLLDKAREIDNRAHDYLHEVEKTEPESWEKIRSRLEAAWDDMMTELSKLEDIVAENNDVQDNGG